MLADTPLSEKNLNYGTLPTGDDILSNSSKNASQAQHGTRFLEWLLGLEQSFTTNRISSIEPACSFVLGRIIAVLLGAILLIFFVLHFFLIRSDSDDYSKDYSTMYVSVFMELTASVALFSTVWTMPLAISLGLDNKGDQGTAALGEILNDATTRRMGIASILIFVAAPATDVLFFLEMADAPPPIIITVVYIVGSIVTNIGLILGAGYVSFVQNALSAQIQALARQLEHETEVVTSASLTARVLVLSHAEFRRRMDVLAKRFHPRVFLAMIAMLIELVIMVKDGFQESGHRWNHMQRVGLIGGFFANAIALWFMTCSIGRAPFVSREECAFEAYKWCLLTNQGGDGVHAANLMTYFPIRFHVGMFELSEELSKAVTFVLLGLAGLFVGIHIPEL